MKKSTEFLIVYSVMITFALLFSSLLNFSLIEKLESKTAEIEKYELYQKVGHYEEVIKFNTKEAVVVELTLHSSRKLSSNERNVLWDIYQMETYRRLTKDILFNGYKSLGMVDSVTIKIDPYIEFQLRSDSLKNMLK